MKNDCWFTRGWTLQELLAPKSMKFYQRDWAPLIPGSGINDKRKAVIQKIIYEATGINHDELVAFNPIAGSDVPSRMAWAATRVTTRGEDRAYSLMGIFGVNFSTSYGEGAERAFFRLIEAIISTRPAEHVFPVLAWGGKPVSDKIHTSHLIPSSPECYLEDYYASDSNPDNPPADNFVPSIVKPMMLTHLGLRVELLFIRIDTVKLIRRDDQIYGPFDVKLDVTPSPLSHIRRFKVELQKRFASFPAGVGHVYDNAQKADGTGHNFFLGIYTFTEDEEDESIHIPLSCQGFVLGLYSPSEVSMRSLSPRHFKPSSKIDTRALLRLRRSTDSTVKKAALDMQDMKLLNLYL